MVGVITAQPHAPAPPHGNGGLPPRRTPATGGLPPRRAPAAAGLLPLAHRLAVLHRRGREPLAPLAAIATAALLQAIETYRPADGAADLSTHAVRSMLRALRRHRAAWTPDLDEAVRRTDVALGNRLGRRPTASELAGAAGIDIEDILDVLERRRAARHPTQKGESP
jgi:RNA polymerase sigma-B factor